MNLENLGVQSPSNFDILFSFYAIQYWGYASYKKHNPSFSISISIIHSLKIYQHFPFQNQNTFRLFLWEKNPNGSTRDKIPDTAFADWSDTRHSVEKLWQRNAKENECVKLNKNEEFF